MSTTVLEERDLAILATIAQMHVNDGCCGSMTPHDVKQDLDMPIGNILHDYLGSVMEAGWVVYRQPWGYQETIELTLPPEHRGWFCQRENIHLLAEFFVEQCPDQWSLQDIVDYYSGFDREPPQEHCVWDSAWATKLITDME